MITFQSFQGLHLVLAATLLALVFLALILLLVKGKNKASPPLDHPVEPGFCDIDETGEELMGKAVLEQGVSILGADEFGFVDKSRQLGALPDFQQDIREICRVIAENDGNKEDFLLMFPMIRSKYPHLAASPLLPALNAFIRESVPFQLSPQELENLWD
ncbi:hypothetical protein ABIE26_003607 [Pedobacter africanus]|uniref:hypothetical protein n=1 Tax=Pedobacter africanus TaxID=151894 RepID=UPI003398BAEE